MSGWYVFNALGFYPVTPGTGEYVLGMPLLDEATLFLSNGKELKVHSTPNQPQQQFIDNVTLNGKQHSRLFFTHDELIAGSTIRYTLGIVPRSKTWSAEAYPYSLSHSQESNEDHNENR